MKIYLLDRNFEMVEAWLTDFSNIKDVSIIHSDLDDFLDESDVECVVSPANSYGIMRGGYDLAISMYFGFELEQSVQKRIRELYDGVQPVGTSIIVDIPRTNKKLIHTPTMKVPSRISDPKVIYRSMKSTLELALENNIKSIVIPAFGGATGGVEYHIISKMMKDAFDDVINQ